MSSKKSITKNYIYNLIYQVVAFIIPLVTTPYISRVLGAENIGIYSFTASIVTYFILFGSLGVAMYGQREIAYVQDDIKARSKTFYEILLMRFTTIGSSLVVFYFTFCQTGEYSIYYKILILEIIANAVDISWFFQGLEEFKKTVMRNLAVKLICLAGIFVFVKSPNDLIVYILIYMLSALIGNLSLWLYLPKYIQKVKIKDLKVFKHLKPTIALFIPQIAIQIYTVLDKTMIGVLVEDKSEVGFYEQAQKMVKMLLTVATSLGTVMQPRIAHTFAKGDMKKLKEYIDTSFKFVSFLAFPLMFGIASISSKFVPIFYGEGYEKVIILICIISPIIVAIGLSNLMGIQYLLPTKKQKEFTISVTAGAIINFIFNMIFIPLWQSIGASAATVIAECAVIAIQLYFVRKEIKTKDVIMNSKNYFIASVIMFVITMLINIFVQQPVLSITIQVVIGVIVYFAILFVLKDDLVKMGMKKVIKQG